MGLKGHAREPTENEHMLFRNNSVLGELFCATRHSEGEDLGRGRCYLRSKKEKQKTKKTW